MIKGKDEARNTLEYKKHYVLLPTFSNQIAKKYLIDPITRQKGKFVPKNFEYNSSNIKDRLTVESIKNLINKIKD